MRLLLVTVALSLLALAGCGAEETSSEPQGDGCACSGGQCSLGTCVVEVQVDPDCAQPWGQAQVYLGDVSAEAEPAGVASVDAPFRSCQGFQARVTEQEAAEAGVSTQEGESIPLQVVSQDMRLVFPTGNAAVQCSGSEPLVLVMGCN
jgi:hypothetical protein